MNAHSVPFNITQRAALNAVEPYKNCPVTSTHSHQKFESLIYVQVTFNIYIISLTHCIAHSFFLNRRVIYLHIQFSTFYANRMIITTFTGYRTSSNLSRIIQSMRSHLISSRFILILFSHLCLRLPSGHFFRLHHRNPSPLPYMTHAPPTSSSFICQPK